MPGIPPHAARVLGVDACRAGWVGVLLAGPAPPLVHVASRLADVLAWAAGPGPLSAVGVDMPIGLSDEGPREADLLARARVGRLRATVFLMPVRAALQAPDFATAQVINRARAGQGVSRQAYGLRRRVAEARAVARSAGLPVLEVHPEVSFAAMAGAPLGASKHTPAGIAQRQALLEAQGFTVAGCLDRSRPGVRVDDLLDAAAVAWTARRYAAGLAVSLPDPPARSADGWPVAVWV